MAPADGRMRAARASTGRFRGRGRGRVRFRGGREEGEGMTSRLTGRTHKFRRARGLENATSGMSASSGRLAAGCRSIARRCRGGGAGQLGVEWVQMYGFGAVQCGAIVLVCVLFLCQCRTGSSSRNDEAARRWCVPWYLLVLGTCLDGYIIRVGRDLCWSPNKF